MEQAVEGGDAVHRVKRGRPAKSTFPLQGHEAVGKIHREIMEMIADSMESPSQAYAMRVWSGQSIDVPRAERIERCMNALRGQNLPTDGVTFP